jgi:hypothetical protein
MESDGTQTLNKMFEMINQISIQKQVISALDLIVIYKLWTY